MYIFKVCVRNEITYNRNETIQEVAYKTVWHTFILDGNRVRDALGCRDDTDIIETCLIGGDPIASKYRKGGYVLTDFSDAIFRKLFYEALQNPAGTTFTGGYYKVYDITEIAYYTAASVIDIREDSTYGFENHNRATSLREYACEKLQL